MSPDRTRSPAIDRSDLSDGSADASVSGILVESTEGAGLPCGLTVGFRLIMGFAVEVADGVTPAGRLVVGVADGVTPAGGLGVGVADGVTPAGGLSVGVAVGVTPAGGLGVEVAVGVTVGVLVVTIGNALVSGRALIRVCSQSYA